MYTYEDGFVIDVKEDAILNHTASNELNPETWIKPKSLPSKDHKPSIIQRGLYFVGIQRKFNPLKKFMEKVKD
jgi:hypothetical protein